MKNITKPNVVAASIMGLVILSMQMLAGSKPFHFNCRTKIVCENDVFYENRCHTFDFQVLVVSDYNGVKSEEQKWGKPFIQAYPNERYRVRLYNPLPIRVAVNLSIDGLNSISGKPGKPDEGRKWVIAPYSYAEISGWQVSQASARRFYFTSRESSYAAWRSKSWGIDLSVNCGVIGAAYFWSKKEMEEYFENNPVHEYRDTTSAMGKDETENYRATHAKGEEKRKQAGTGMGEHASHPVVQIHFDYDTGMYQVKDAVIIYYDFPEKKHRPVPFKDDFAPEVEEGLLASWNFDEGCGDTIHDQSGNGYHGVRFGATWVAGIRGKALDFDGIDDYASFPSDITISGDFTIKYNIRFDTVLSNYQYIMSKHQTHDNTDKGWAMNSGIGFYFLNSPTGTNDLRIIDIRPLTFRPKTWHEMIMTYNDSTNAYHVYLDGNNVGSGTVDFIVEKNTHPFYIASAFPNESGAYGKFTIDNVRIYTRVVR